MIMVPADSRVGKTLPSLPGLILSQQWSDVVAH